MPSARFMMVDGLDGSGKGVIIEAVRKHCQQQNLRVLDLKEHCQEQGAFPSAEEIQDSDVIVSHEPSYSYVGRAIRDEMIIRSREYSAISISHAFALDREVLYRKVIIPAIRLGKIILQERGIVTSVVYQPVQERIPLSEIIHLPGNRLALQHAPGLLVITKVNPDIALSRNMGKNGANTIFENLFFQRKIEERYNSDWLRALFEKSGSLVRYIDTNPPKTIDELQTEALKIWNDAFPLPK